MPLPPGSRPASRALARRCASRAAAAVANQGGSLRSAAAVRAGVRHQEDEVTDGIVSEFQGEPPLQGLAVGDPRLRLDPSPPAVRWRAADLRVPRPEVAIDREWHFRAPAERWVEPRAKPLEKRKLRPVADRIAGRIGADREVKADEPRTTPPELRHRTCDPSSPRSNRPELAVRRARRGRDLAQTQARGDAGESVRRSPTRRTRSRQSPSSAIGRAFARSHRRISVARPSPPAYLRDCHA